MAPVTLLPLPAGRVLSGGKATSTHGASPSRSRVARGLQGAGEAMSPTRRLLGSSTSAAQAPGPRTVVGMGLLGQPWGLRAVRRVGAGGMLNARAQVPPHCVVQKSPREVQGQGLGVTGAWPLRRVSDLTGSLTLGRRCYVRAVSTPRHTVSATASPRTSPGPPSAPSARPPAGSGGAF